jgi:predicted dehydrogenase
MNPMLNKNYDRDRRLFVKAGLIAAASPVFSFEHASQADEKTKLATGSSSQMLRVGIIGVNGRGGALAKTVLSTEQATITHVCDVDQNILRSASRSISQLQGSEPRQHTDLRRMLEAQDLDAAFVAAPNHWHAPATIIACEAGKHVYVEKPCSHNPAEGEWAVQAARKHKRVVQTGTQRRSWATLVEGMHRLHSGEIGEVLYARCWYNNRRPSIGNEMDVDPPASLDWELWQGPAPRREYRANYAPYNWHWFWAWGNGEVGNNGVHGIDLARWGMRLNYPTRVTATGSKVRFDDDQETPDTLTVGFEFEDGRSLTWQGLSWSPLGEHDTSFGVSFHGTDGTMVMRSTGYTLFDMRRKLVDERAGKADDRAHVENFFACIRTGEMPAADIQIGHESALLCHLANISYREQRSLAIDPTNGHLADLELQRKHWERQYEPGWRPTLF